MAARVVIAGGGSGATILANALDHRRFEVTMVSASLEHLFQPALLYIAFKGASANPVRDQRRLLTKTVALLHDRVTRVDMEHQRVETAGGEHLDYDYLVLATGMGTDPAQIPGLAEISARFGDYHSTVAQARRLWQSLRAFGGGTIALGQSSPICKCPPSPIEGILLADELLRARHLRERSRLVFFTPYPRPYPAAPINELVEPILADRGIEVMPFFDVDRIDVASSTIHSIEGDEVHFDLPIIVPPFVGADITYEPPDVVDPDRFVITDQRTLRVKGMENVFAIGDGANLPTSKAGVGAHLEAGVVARTLQGRPASFNGRTNCPFDLAGGRGTFVIGSYDAPVVKLRPSRLHHVMKMLFGRIYWLSLRGWLEPAFRLYFRITAPPSRRAGAS